MNIDRMVRTMLAAPIWYTWTQGDTPSSEKFLDHRIQGDIPSSGKQYKQNSESQNLTEKNVVSGRLWTPTSLCKTQWSDSMFVVYEGVMSRAKICSLSGAHPIEFPITIEDNPTNGLTTPRRVNLARKKQMDAKAESLRQEAVTNSIATPRGKQWLELAMFDGCDEVSFEGNFFGLGLRRELPGFTLFGTNGVCYHFAAETFEERSNWHRGLCCSLTYAPSPLSAERGFASFLFPRKEAKLFPNSSSPHSSPERLNAASAPNHERRSDGREMDPLEVASEHSNSTNFRLENAIDFIVENDVNLVNSQSIAEATQSDGNTELYVERELKRRFERKNRILEKAIVEVRQDSEGLRQALMAALDRLAMFSSNSVPAMGVVQKSAGNWLQVESQDEITEKLILRLTTQAVEIEALLLDTTNRMQRNAQTLERQMRAADGLARLKAELEVERLKAELDTMQLDVQSYEAGLAAATKELNQVQLHLQDTERCNRLLRAQIQVNQQDIDALHSSGQEMSGIKSELLSAYKQIELYKAELSKMQSALGDSQQEIALLAKESALAKAQKEHAEILMAKARDLEEATTEVATLKHQLQMVQSELLVSQQDLKASLEALKEKERARVTAAEQVVKLKELAEQVVKLKTELEDMTNSRDEALKEKEKGRVTAEKGRVTFAEQVVKLKKELVDMKNSLRGELDLALGKLEKETDRIADLNVKNTDLHNELDALKSKVEALDASKAKLMSGLELSQQRKDVDGDEIKSLKLQIDQVKQALEEAHTLEMTKLVDRRQAESEFAQVEIFRLKAELLNAQSEIHNIQNKSVAEFDFLNRQNERHVQQLADLDADVVKLTSALSEANHDLGEERAHRQDLQHSLIDYDRKLAALVSERERLLLDREELQVEEDKRKEQIEHLQKGEQHSKKSEAQSQEKLHRLQLEMQQMQRHSDAATSQSQHEILRCKVVMDQLMDSHDECHKLVEALEMDLHALSLLQQEHARGRKQAREDVAAQLSPTAPQQDANFEPVGDWEIRPLSVPAIPSLPSDKISDPTVQLEERGRPQDGWELTAMRGMAGDSEHNACLENIKELDSLADSLKALGAQLKKGGGVRSSTGSLVQRIQDQTDHGRNISHETGQYLKMKLEDKALSTHLRPQLEKLARQFELAGRKFEAVSRQVVEELRSANAEVGGDGGVDEQDREPPVIPSYAPSARGRQQQQLLQSQMEEPLLDASSVEHMAHNTVGRNLELRQLEADLGDLHTLFKDVATLAQMQQEHLDTIEGAVMETGMRVVAGTNELQKAYRTQKKTRRRMCCMLVSGLVVVTIMLIWILAPLFH